MIVKFGSLTILTDPMLGPDGFTMGDPNVADLNTVKFHRRLTPFRDVDLSTIDLVLLSHGHEDHFDQQARASLGRALPIMLPLGDVEAVQEEGFENLDAVVWGETRLFESGSGHVEITATVAQHSRDPQTAKILGAGNGYWIEFSDGDWQLTMYWTGDTMPTADVVAAIKTRGEPDVMVPHVGRVGTSGPLGQISMGATDVVAFAAEIRPRWVAPIHHSTYAFYPEPITDLVAKSSPQPYRLVLAEGIATVYQ